VDELYVAARRVLLDGLEALGVHRGALILVGAQAVYLRVGEADLAVAPYTTDADLAVVPSQLAELPPLEQSLRDASFRPKSAQSVGIWVTTRSVSMKDVDIAIDLLVPTAASRNANSRAADLTGHDRKAARNVEGLDGALIDNDLMEVKSLDHGDERTFDLLIAGPAGLLTSKLYKIADRIDTGRLSDKDALDVLRLLRGTTTDDLSRRYRNPCRSDVCLSRSARLRVVESSVHRTQCHWLDDDLSSRRDACRSRGARSLRSRPQRGPSRGRTWLTH